MRRTVCDRKRADGSRCGDVTRGHERVSALEVCLLCYELGASERSGTRAGPTGEPLTARIDRELRARMMADANHWLNPVG